MTIDRSELLPGTLDLMILKILDSMGPLHGYGIARRIEQASGGTLEINPGTVFASLLRLSQRRWVSTSWNTSENNRRAKFYAITRAGRTQLATEAAQWRRVSGMMDRLLRRPAQS